MTYFKDKYFYLYLTAEAAEAQKIDLLNDPEPVSDKAGGRKVTVVYNA